MQPPEGGKLRFNGWKGDEWHKRLLLYEYAEEKR